MGIIVVVKDLADMMAGTIRYSHIVRFVFSIVTLVTNMVLQVWLLEYVYIYVVRRSVHNFQQDYKAFHETVFTSDGQWTQAGWDAFPNKQSLCESAMSDKQFLGCILFLWTLRMLQEYRE